MLQVFKMVWAALIGLFAFAGEKLHSALFGYMANTGMVLGAAPMRNTDFRAVVEPILNQFFDGVYDQRKDEWKQVFREVQATIERAYFEEPVGYGFGAAPELPDGMPVTYQQGGILFNKRYTYKV